MAKDLTNELGDLIVCPGCNMVHKKVELAEGEIGACQRCDLEFVFPPLSRFDHTLALGITTLALATISLHLPFLAMSRSGLSNEQSIIAIALSFFDGWFAIVGILFVCFVLVFPVLRALGLIYALLPLTLGKPPFRHAKQVFKFSEILGPWAMTEIFLVGSAVALVKVTKLAKVDFQLGFWVFTAMVIASVLMDLTLHRKNVVAVLGQGQT